jgi:hypothetical protein
MPFFKPAEIWYEPDDLILDLRPERLDPRPRASVFFFFSLDRSEIGSNKGTDSKSLAADGKKNEHQILTTNTHRSDRKSARRRTI